MVNLSLLSILFLTIAPYKTLSYHTRSSLKSTLQHRRTLMVGDQGYDSTQDFGSQNGYTLIPEIEWEVVAQPSQITEEELKKKAFDQISKIFTARAKKFESLDFKPLPKNIEQYCNSFKNTPSLVAVTKGLFFEIYNVLAAQVVEAWLIESPAICENLVTRPTQETLTHLIMRAITKLRTSSSTNFLLSLLQHLRAKTKTNDHQTAFSWLEFFFLQVRFCGELRLGEFQKVLARVIVNKIPNEALKDYFYVFGFFDSQ